MEDGQKSNLQKVDDVLDQINNTAGRIVPLVSTITGIAELLIDIFGPQAEAQYPEKMAKLRGLLAESRTLDENYARLKAERAGQVSSGQ